MVKFIFVIAALIVLAASCAKDGTDYQQRTSFFGNIRYGETADSTLTTVTYNIQLGFPVTSDPWNKDAIGGTHAQIASLKEVLIKVHPDIICLQEVPRNRYNTEVKEFIRELAGELNMNYAFGAHGYNDPYGIEPVQGEWGNAILSRFEILELDNRENEYQSTWERRSILMAGLKLNQGVTLYTYSLHHLPSDKAVPNSIGFFREKKGAVQLIMGDFNMVMVPELDLEGYRDMIYQDSALRYSIDRIYLTNNTFDILETGMIPGSEGVSDHLPVYCRLRVNGDHVTSGKYDKFAP